MPGSRRPTQSRLRSRHFQFFGGDRQGEMKRRATPAVTVGPNPAALLFDDRLTDCQAYAGALRLRRKERVEYLVGLAHGQPGPCVMNRNLDLAVLIQLRLRVFGVNGCFPA